MFEPAGDVQDSWRWIGDLAVAAGKRSAPLWWSFDDVVRDLVRTMPAVFAPVAQVAPPADFRLAGQRIPRQPHRYSGRTAIHAAETVHEPQPPEDPDSPLAFTMEGYPNQPPPPLIPRFWAPGWNSVQSLNKFQEEVAGPLRGGNPGRRLIEPGSDSPGRYFDEVPEAFERRDGYLLVVPGYHAFGSEELSILSPALAELAPKPYIAVNPEDAARLWSTRTSWWTWPCPRRPITCPSGSRPRFHPGWPWSRWGCRGSHGTASPSGRNFSRMVDG